MSTPYCQICGVETDSTQSNPSRCYPCYELEALISQKPDLSLRILNLLSPGYEIKVVKTVVLAGSPHRNKEVTR